MVGFDALPPGLSVGELAEVTLSLPASERAVVLPNAAVRHVDGRTGVWTVAGGALRFAPVRLGALGLDGEVQVLEGVAPGTTVVVHSEKELGAGSRFEVVPSLAGAPR